MTIFATIFGILVAIGAIGYVVWQVARSNSDD